MTPSTDDIAKTLRGYLPESLRIIRAWMNLYFSTIGIFVLLLVVTAFQLERECSAISDGSLFDVPIDLPEDCLDEAGGKPEVKFLGVTVIRDFVSLILGGAFMVFIAVLWLRIRALTVLLGRLGSLSEGSDRTGEIACGIRNLPWLGSPFREGRTGPAIFWGGLGVGLAMVGLTAVIHLFFECGEVEIDCGLYRAIGAVNLMFFALSLTCLIHMSRDVSTIRSAFPPSDGPMPVA